MSCLMLTIHTILDLPFALVPAGVEIELICLSGLSENLSGQVDCATELICRTSR